MLLSVFCAAKVQTYFVTAKFFGVFFSHYVNSKTSEGTLRFKMSTLKSVPQAMP